MPTDRFAFFQVALPGSFSITQRVFFDLWPAGASHGECIVAAFRAELRAQQVLAFRAAALRIFAIARAQQAAAARALGRDGQILNGSRYARSQKGERCGSGLENTRSAALHSTNVQESSALSASLETLSRQGTAPSSVWNQTLQRKFIYERCPALKKKINERDMRGTFVVRPERTEICPHGGVGIQTPDGHVVFVCPHSRCAVGRLRAPSRPARCACGTPRTKTYA